MLFSSFYYDRVYKKLKSNHRVMKLKHIEAILPNGNLDFELNMPVWYREKLIVFKIKGEKYVFAPTAEMRKNETSSTT
jgi:hypothetical protein